MLTKQGHEKKADFSMYYIAALCPTNTNEKVLAIKNWLKERFGCVHALKSPAHITLIAPFWWENANADSLKTWLGSFTGYKSVGVTMNGVSAFGNRTLFIDVKSNIELEDLKNSIEAHFSSLSSSIIPKDTRPFHPHITLATRDLKPRDFKVAFDHCKKLPFNYSFDLKSFALMLLKDGKWVIMDEIEVTNPSV